MRSEGPLFIQRAEFSHDGELTTSLQPLETLFQDWKPPEIRKTPSLERMRGSAPWVLAIAEAEVKQLSEALEPLFRHRQTQREVDRVTIPAFAREQLPAALHHWMNGVQVLNELECVVVLAGSLEAIPFEVSLELGAVHSVGRLCFRSPEEYAAYGARLIRADEVQARRRQDAKLAHARMLYMRAFSDETAVSRHSRENLVAPLLSLAAQAPCEPEGGSPIAGTCELRGTDVPVSLGLSEELASAPGLFVGVAHGMCPSSSLPLGSLAFSPGEVLQGPSQDPSSSQEGTAPSASEPVLTALAASRLALLVSCYGAGAQFDAAPPLPGYGIRTDVARDQLAPLPQALLLWESGPLAVLAHVDRLWVPCLVDAAGNPVIVGQQWELLLAARSLLFGRTLEDALDPLQIARQQSADLYRSYLEQRCTLELDVLEQPRLMLELNTRLMLQWLRYYDACGWLVMGDPAVSLGCTPQRWNALAAARTSEVSKSIP